MAYVKLNRDVLDSGIFADTELLGFYVKLVMMCRVAPVVEMECEVQRGQFLTSLRRLSELFDCSIQHTRTCLRKLKSARLIEVCSNSQYSVISVINYDCREGFQRAPASDSTHGSSNSSHGDQQTDNTASLLNFKMNNVNLRAPRAQKESDSDSLKAAEIERENVRSVSDRQRLVDRFGEANVADYEQRFELWRARQKRSVSISCYAAIERWMREDNVTKPSESSFNTEDIMRRVRQTYSGTG